MKIIAIGPKRFFFKDGFTGDATQMRKTTAFLKLISGVNLTYAFYDEHYKLSSENGDDIEWEHLSSRYDIAHIFTMFPRTVPSHVTAALAQLPSVLSCVYWNNIFREWICVKNGDSARRLLRSLEYIFFRVLGLKQDTIASWCSGILPNSWAEGNCFRQYYSLPKHATCYAVPNAIEIPDGARDLPRPSFVPEGDYIVYPGVFARRKNQLGFIKAMRNSSYPVVFMGQPQKEYEGYYQQCRELANKHMRFIGHRNNTDKEYWAVLRHARAAVLASDCETPGIAMIEAAAMGARPIITQFGGTQEYFGLSGEYLSPFSSDSIRQAVQTGWQKGRLSQAEASDFERFSWAWTAALTYDAYKATISNWKSKR